MENFYLKTKNNTVFSCGCKLSRARRLFVFWKLLLFGSLTQMSAQVAPYTYKVFETDFSMIATVTSSSSSVATNAGYSYIRTTINNGTAPAWTYLGGAPVTFGGWVIGTSTSTSYIELPAIDFNEGGIVVVEFGSGSNRTYTLTDNTGSATGVSGTGNFKVDNTVSYPRNTVLTATLTLDAAQYDGSKIIRINFPGGSDSRLFRVTVYTKAAGGGGCVDASYTTSLHKTGWTAAADYQQTKHNTYPNGNYHNPMNLIDGNTSNEWSTVDFNQTSGNWVSVDMGSAKQFSRIVMHCYNNGGYPAGYDVYVSNDGSNWGSPIASGGTGSCPTTTIDFSMQNARYFKIQLNAGRGDWWKISEIDVYNVCSGTSPLSLPTGLDETLVCEEQVELSWNSVSGATSYKVYVEKCEKGGSSALPTITEDFVSNMTTGTASGDCPANGATSVTKLRLWTGWTNGFCSGTYTLALPSGNWTATNIGATSDRAPSPSGAAWSIGLSRQTGVLTLPTFTNVEKIVFYVASRDNAASLVTNSGRGIGFSINGVAQTDASGTIFIGAEGSAVPITNTTKPGYSTSAGFFQFYNAWTRVEVRPGTTGPVTLQIRGGSDGNNLSDNAVADFSIIFAGGGASCNSIANSPFTVTNPEKLLENLEAESDYRYKVTAIRGAGTAAGDSAITAEWKEFSTNDIPCCITPATAAFSSGNSVSKSTTDSPFINTLTTNNTNTASRVWSSSNTSVATVNATGQVTIVGEGLTTIRVTQTIDGNICALDASYTLTVACPYANLTTPTLQDPSLPTMDGFTVAWSATPNAVSYTVRVYQGATVIQSVSVTPPAVSAVITGLNANTAYTYSVQAIANGTTYCNSPETAKSKGVTTLAPPPASPCGNDKVTLYYTDFSDWTEGRSGGSSGSYYPISSGGGAGFQFEGGITVNTDGISPNSSGRDVIFPAFNFISGGTVTFEIVYVSQSTRQLTDQTGQATPNSHSMNPSGTYTFTFPSSFTGMQQLRFDTGNAGYIIKKITVCTNPGSTPLITTNPTPGTGCQMSFSAEINGNTNTQQLYLKGFNLTSDVQVSITGPGASRFSVSSSTIAEASAESVSGAMLSITYTSSVLVSTHDAVITLTSPGAEPVSINLCGASYPSGGGCMILTPSQVQLFAAQLIALNSKTISIKGINLSGTVTLSITGIDASQFMVSPSTVPATAANTSLGAPVTVTYLGDIEVGNHTANLVISNGACTVSIPLQGRTMTYPPTMYTLTLIAQPPEGGFITTDIIGPEYPSGTIVKLTAVAETGYKFVRWQDVTSYSPTRNITMDAHKTIVAIFEPSSTGSKGNLLAYNITDSTATSFRAHWDVLTDATQYTINVYEQDANGLPGTLVMTQTAPQPSPLTDYASAVVAGLTPGKAYFYQVIANTPLGDTSEMLGSYPVGPLQAIICGVDN